MSCFLPVADDAWQAVSQTARSWNLPLKLQMEGRVRGFMGINVVPWYIEGFRRGEGYSFIGCDQCHPQWRNATHAIRDISLALKRRETWRHVIHATWALIIRMPRLTKTRRWVLFTIWSMKHGHWIGAWNDVALGGLEMRSPTCQTCHMYNYKTGTWGHNVTSKGRWRMGTFTPVQVEYKSSMKDYPYGITIPPMDKKIDLYDGPNKKKLEMGGAFSNCHSGRFARLWFEALDEYMFATYRKRDEAQLLVEECFEGWIDVKNRGFDG